MPQKDDTPPRKAITRRRQRAFIWGTYAEVIAAIYLMAKGYVVLARRFRTPQGEIDLIARRASTIAFVEVKARASLSQCLEAVTPRAEWRLSRAAGLWLARNPSYAPFTLRYDILAIRPWRAPVHIISAFEARER